MKNEVGLANELFRCEVGSTSHGLGIEGRDDLDLMGVYIEPLDYTFGLKTPETVVIRDKPEGVRSEPGDTDLVLHPLRKWVKLALNGNPTIIALMFAPIVQYSTVHEQITMVLRYMGPKKLLSHRCITAYLGYLTQQKLRMLGEKGQKRTKRPELVEEFGYDTKYAMHALRLGLQGLELAETGKLSFPMEDGARALLRGIRQGGFSQEEAIRLIESSEEQLESVKDSAPALPPEPDKAWADEFLINAHGVYWQLRKEG